MNQKIYFLVTATLLLTANIDGSQTNKNERQSYSESTKLPATENNSSSLFDTLIAPTFVLGTAGYLSYQYLTQPQHPDIIVHNLAEKQLNFSTNFAWGIATASSQNEEDSLNNSWTSNYLQKKGKSDYASPGPACNSWTQWQDDIEKAAFLGVTNYRLSIEWSRVQPLRDAFDKDAINHYIAICKILRAKGINPMICLHHYSDPVWFLQAGGFSKEKNIKLFTDFCQKMYESLRPYVDQWIVISQPAAYALKGYSQGMQPPFLKNSALAQVVMLNLFKSHIAVYDMMHNAFNKTQIGLQPQVGLCHQITQMQAYTPYSPLDHAVATAADRLYNKALLRFFRTGHLRFLQPFVDAAYIPQAPQKFDFFALSYYCPKSFIRTTPTTPKVADTHLTADLSRVIDKQGMYDAIVQASQLGKPVIVVESGINPVDDTQRILLLNSYLSALSQAITDGYDVRGYYHWTLMDNYEWAQPFDYSHFGLYKNRVINQDGNLDPDFKNHEKMLKISGKYYQQIIARQHQKADVAIDVDLPTQAQSKQKHHHEK